MQLHLNIDLKSCSLTEVSRRPTFLKCGKYFVPETTLHPGYQVWSCWECNTLQKFPTPSRSLPESLCLPEGGFDLGLGYSAGLTAGEIFNLWMESLCSRAVASHSGIKRGWFDLEIEVRKSFEMQDQFFNFSFEVIKFLQFYSFQYYFPF